MNRIAIMKSSTKAKLLSGTYILQQTLSKFKKRQISAICLMCNSDIEDTPHFLIKCPSLERTRQPFIDKIKTLLNTVDKELYKSIYNQRLSRACIVHLVIKKTNWSYVKTMSCSGSHLEITINIKYTKFVKDLPMIDAQFRFNQCNSFREEYISVFSPYGPVLTL